MNPPGRYGARDFDISVVVTAVATRAAGLESAAFDEAKSAFEAYQRGGVWVDARGNTLVAQIESEITQGGGFDSYSNNPKWQAQFRVGVLAHPSVRHAMAVNRS